jgi:hypothetical protein
MNGTVSEFLRCGLAGGYSGGSDDPNDPVVGDLSSVLGDAFIISPAWERYIVPSVPLTLS